MDDLLGFTGIALVLAGIYLWLGLAATLIIAGLVLMYIGARWPGRSEQEGERLT